MKSELSFGNLLWPPQTAHLETAFANDPVTLRLLQTLQVCPSDLGAR